MNEPKTELVSHDAALDWVTLSAPMEPGHLDKFHAWMQQMQRDLQGGENPEKEVREGAYRGVKIGTWQFKHRAFDGHCKVNVEGRDAEAAIEMIEGAGIGYRITRLDGQITGRHKRPNLDYASELRDIVRAFRSEKGARQRQAMATFSDVVADTGITLGSRASAVYCRVYDYEAKHCNETTHSLWRYEVEHKEDAAPRFAQEWLKSDNRRELVARVVSSRLEKFGIPLGGIGMLEKLLIAGTKTPGSVESRLKYTEKMIVPFLARLAQDGAEDEIKELFRRYCLTDSGNVLLCGSLYPPKSETTKGDGEDVFTTEDFQKHGGSR